ncbi:Inorganic diphosphatase [Handroanthus impetiginosus]|uniref:Inorganic diphosphatase n=1 Tax=Handroanthus impetiginosus TaxID=429701 RepID=A0A2G9GIR2_9LAMI|nr:Inorganic diphosphatase [Handroanthus impetiginosus]
MAGIMVVIDFDKTIIEVDSATDLFNQLVPTMPWYSVMARMIIEKIQASLANEGKKRMIYIGDGAGDFCPSLKLKDGDFMMPRKNFPVWDLKCKNRTRLRAKVHEWVYGEALEHILLTLIEKMSIEGTINSNPAQLLSVHCKSNTIAVAAQEALPPPLQVHQWRAVTSFFFSFFFFFIFFIL